MGRKVKAFLHKLVNSIVPQNTYYGHILRQKFKPSLLYYLVLLSLTSVVAVGIMLVHVSKNNPAKIDTCLQYSLKTVPKDFSLHIQKGVLSTNQTMPLFIWFNCNDKIRLLAVIDERATEEDINSYNAQILATGSELVARYRTYLFAFPYKKYMPDLRADKAVVVDYMTKGLEVLKMYISLLSLSVVVLTPLVLFALNIVNLFFSSLLVLIFFRVLKRHYTFKTVLHIGMHSSTFPILTSLLFLIFPVHVTNTLILFFFLIFIFQLVGVYEAHYIEASSHHK